MKYARIRPANLGWNLAGAVLPALASIIAIPLTLRMLDTQRFGLLSLTWVLAAYLMVLDFGLTRAITRFAAAQFGAARPDDVPGMFACAMLIMRRLATAGSVIAGAASLYAIHSWLEVPDGLRAEASWSMALTCASIPALVSAGGWRAIAEVLGRFDATNRVLLPLGVASAIAPVAALYVANSLIAVMAALLAIRVVQWLLFRRLAIALFPQLRGAAPDFATWRRPLTGFGGWSTVSGLLGPVMVYLDRFLIGAFLSLTALAYYSVSYELATRAWLLVGAATGVLLPAVSNLLKSDAPAARHAYHVSLATVLALVLAPVAVLALLSREILLIWLNAEFATNSAVALCLLSIGVLINCMGQTSLTVVQAAGRTDWIAKLHMAEVLPYLLLLYWGAMHYGVTGVALAWAARAAIDAVFMLILANRIIEEPGRPQSGHLVAFVAICVLLLMVSQVDSVLVRATFAVLTVAFCAVVGAWAYRAIRFAPSSMPAGGA